MLVYSQGTAIGRFLDFYSASIWVLSDKGFIFEISTIAGPIRYLGSEQRVYFANTDCTGAAYVNEFVGGGFGSLGIVFRADGGAPAANYYTPRGVQPSSIAYGSFAANNQCNVEAVTDFFLPAFPNDPLVTAVSDTAPALPLKIGLP